MTTHDDPFQAFLFHAKAVRFSCSETERIFHSLGADTEKHARRGTQTGVLPREIEVVKGGQVLSPGPSGQL